LRFFVFRVVRRPRERLPDPCRADLEPPMRRLDVHVARRADRPAAITVDRDEGQRYAGVELFQRLVDIRARFFGPRNRGHLRLPHCAVGGGGSERRRDGRGAIGRHRLEAPVPPFERHRIGERHLYRPARDMKATRSKRCTSCSFLSRAPCSGGISTFLSELRNASGGMSSASKSFSQSRSSEVDGFFLRPGTSRRSKKTSRASVSSAFLSPGK